MTVEIRRSGIPGPGSDVLQPLADAAAASATLSGLYANSDTDADIPGAAPGERGAKYWAGEAGDAAASFVVTWNTAGPTIDRVNSRMRFPTGVFRQRGAASSTGILAQDVAWPDITTPNTYYLDTTDATIKVLGAGAVPPVGNQFVILGTFRNGLWTPFNTPPAIDGEGSLLNLNSFALGEEILVDLTDTLGFGGPSILVPLQVRYAVPGFTGLTNVIATNTPTFVVFGGYTRIAVGTTVFQRVIWYDPNDNTFKLATHPTKASATGPLNGVRILEFTGSLNSIRVPMGLRWRSLGTRHQNAKANLRAALRSPNHSVVIAQIGDSNSVAEGADAIETYTIPASPHQINLPVYGQRGFTSVVANGTTLTMAAAGASPAANEYAVSGWNTASDRKGRTLTFHSSRAGQSVVINYNPEIAPRGQNIRDTRYPRTANSWPRQMGRQMASIACGSQNEAFLPRTESLTVASAAVTLGYAPVPESIAISGYTEIYDPAATIGAAEFRMSKTTPGRLDFNATANGATLSVTYRVAAAVRCFRDVTVATASAEGSASSIFTYIGASGEVLTPSINLNAGSLYKAMLQIPAPSTVGFAIGFTFTGDQFTVVHTKVAGALGTWQIEVDGTVVQTVNFDIDGTTAFNVQTAVTGLTFGHHVVRLIQQSTTVFLRIEAVIFRKYFEHWNLSSYGSNSSHWVSGSSTGLLAAAIPSYATHVWAMIGTNDRNFNVDGTNAGPPHRLKGNMRNIMAWLAANRSRAQFINILPPEAFGVNDIYGGGSFFASSDDIARAQQDIAIEYGAEVWSYYDVTSRYEIENGSVPTTETWPNGLHFRQPVQNVVAASFMRDLA